MLLLEDPTSIAAIVATQTCFCLISIKAMSKNTPLVSICLIAYNQESFIGTAVQSILAQEYDPLEILLSDDCSTDNTYTIMNEMARSYSGPHKVQVLRTPKNLGLSEHVNFVFKHAQGEIFVMAAGDDRSHHDRVACIVEYWRAHDFKPLALTSECRQIDEQGHLYPAIPDWKNQPEINNDDVISGLNGIRWNGCAAAYSRRLYDVFGKLPSGVAEDEMLFCRAHLVGCTVFIPRQLVDYRVWRGSLIGTNDRRRKAKNTYLWRFSAIQQLILDLKNTDRKNDQQLEAVLSEYCRRYRLAVDVIKTENTFKKIVGVVRAIRTDVGLGFSLGRFLFPPLFDSPYTDFLRLLYKINDLKKCLSMALIPRR